jgi:farnesyl-diphosphate farnesyltransferase
MTDRDTDQSDSDLDWCHDAVQSVSRTFALTVSELEEPLTDYICVGYLLCRIPDTIEDATHIPPETQRQLLDTHGKALDPTTDVTIEQFQTEVDEWIPADANDDWQVVSQTERVVGAFREFDDDVRSAMLPAITEMVDGMGTFIDRYEDEGGLRIQSFEELEEYCWYVAGTVGNLITKLLVPVATESQEQEMRSHARDFALLLQIVNIAKDIRPDYRDENNVYIPQTLLDDHNLTPADVGDPDHADSFAPIVRRVSEYAEQYADGAQKWLEAMPQGRGATRSSLAIPFLLSIATLRELKERPADVIAEGGVKVDREEVLAVVAEFHNGHTDVADLRASIANHPFHRPK